MGIRFIIFSFCFGYCCYVSSLYNPTEYEQLKEICAFAILCWITYSSLKYFMQTSSSESVGLIKFSLFLALPLYILFNKSILIEQPLDLQNDKQLLIHYGSATIYILFVLNGVYNILKEKGFDFQSTALKKSRTTTSKKNRVERSKNTGSLKRNTTLKDAILEDDYERAKELLQQGVNPNTVDESGFPVLLIAVRYNRENIVKLLLEKGANPNAECDGLPILAMAVRSHEKMVKLLLQYGADPYRASASGYSAIEAATADNKTKFIRLFEQYRATSNIVNVNETSNIANNLSINITDVNQSSTPNSTSSSRRRKIINSTSKADKIFSDNERKKDTNNLKTGRRLEL